ncbi:MAG TPA: hypothetical protein VII55_02165 [Candidatus Saccharimonadales bacterium]
MADVFSEHLSTDDMTLDADAAAKPAADMYDAIEDTLGVDESYIVVASAVTLYHTLRDELPGNYALPQGEGFIACRN